MKVYKFGGAALRHAEGIRNVASILNSEKGQVLIVASAMDKTTNRLEEMVNAWHAGSGTENLLESVKKFHLEICSQLFPLQHKVFDELGNVFTEISWCLEEPVETGYNRAYDQIVSQGEILSSKILSAVLTESGHPNKWIDARGLIQTDNNYREANVDLELSDRLVSSRLRPEFGNSKLLVTQGFIGGTSENYATTLGREGSDYSAALFAYFLNADSVTIWKDVPGVLNADPKFFSNTRKIDELSYHDAIELAYYGASVIHPKTIKPLQNKNIPLHVKSFADPGKQGTIISGNDKRVAVPTYIFKSNQILISVEPRDFSFIAEDNLSRIFALFSKYRLHVNMMHNSAISFSVCADADKQKMEPLIAELGEQFRVLYNENVQLMTIRNYNPEIIARLSMNKQILLEQRSRHTHQMVMK